MRLYLSKSLFILFFVVFCKTVSGQQKFNNYLPASPNAASLSSGGGTGVNLSSGTANISIPIYVAKSGSIELPVTINYNSQGIKVNDLASSVGLGWSLSVGGIITKQNLRGPDCGFTNIGRSQFVSQFEGYKAFCTVSSDSVYQYGAPIPTIGDDKYYFLFHGAYGDKQSDIYSFNFMGFSGRFFLEGPSTAFLIPYQPLQIEFESRDSSFTITAPDGVKYFFGKFEIGENTSDTRAIVESVCESDMVSDTISILKFPRKVTKKDITAWYLTKIRSGNSSDSIVINYESSPNVITDRSFRYAVTPGGVDIRVYSTDYAYIPPPATSPSSNLETITRWAAEAQRDRVRKLNNFYLNSLAAKVATAAQQVQDFARTGNGTYIQVQNALNNYYNAVDQFQFQSSYLAHSLESDMEMGQYMNVSSIGMSHSSSLSSMNTTGYSLFHDFGVSNEEYVLETRSNPITVKSIDFKDGKIDFVSRYDRSDHEGARIEEILLKKKNGTVYTTLNKFRLSHEYFVSKSQDHLSSSTDKDNYRLKLSKIQQLDTTDLVVSEYKFDYNGLTLPPRKSYSQDYWGYYNMHGNRSLIQSTMKGTTVMGNSRRDVNEDAMQACMLKRIYYPTGGYTDFGFEPHLFSPVSLSETNIPEAKRPVEVIEAFVSAYGLQKTIKQEFIPPADLPVKIKAQLSGMDVNGARSKVTLKDQTLNQVVATYSSDPSLKISYGYDNIAAIDAILKKGHLYELEASMPATYIAPVVVPKDSILLIGKIARISIEYTLGTQVMYAGGGMRIASLKKYDSDGSLISSEQYKYGKDENGLGIQLFGKNAFGPFTTEVNAMSASSDNAWGKCALTETQSSYIDFTTLYGLCGFGGSPVIYDKVTKYYSYNAAVSNGKTMYEFAVHQPVKVDPKSDNYLSFYEDWKDGLLLSQKEYAFSNNNYLPVMEKNNTYKEFSKKQFINPRISIDRQFTGCTDLIKKDMLPNVLFKVKLDKYNSSSLLLTESSTKTFTNGDTTKFVLDKLTYDYDTLHYDQLKKITSVNSKGQSKVSVNKYLFEMPYGPDAIVNSMQDKFMVGTVLENSTLLNNKLLGKTTRKYKLLSSGYPVLDEEESFNGGGVSISKTKYTAYDLGGRILTLTDEGGSINSLIWKSDFPVAQVRNADYVEVFYEGFEDNPAGAPAYAFSGNKGFSGNYTVPFTLPANSTRTFLISYWKKDSNIWRLITSPYTGSITISGVIDEVRVYPKGAEVKTITFSPLIGVTGEMANNGDVRNYYYDNAQRLSVIKDKDGNILKQISYNLIGSSLATAVATPSWQPTGLKDCAKNEEQEYSGEQIIQEKDMNTASASYNTTRWVSVGKSGSCGAPLWNLMRGTERCKLVNGTYTGEEEAQFKDANPLSATYNTVKWKVTGQTAPCQCNATPGFKYNTSTVPGKCAAATKVYTYFSLLTDGTYSCNYYYQYWDNTESPVMTEIRPTAPTVYCTVTVSNNYYPKTTYHTVTVKLTSGSGQQYTIGPVHDAETATLAGIPSGNYTIEINGGISTSQTCFSICRPDGSGASLPKNGTYYKFVNFDLRVTSLTIQQAVEGCYPF